MTLKEFLCSPIHVRSAIIRGKLSALKRTPLKSLDDLEVYILREAVLWDNPNAKDITAQRLLKIVSKEGR